MIHSGYSKPLGPSSETVMLIVSADGKGASVKLPASRHFTRPPERKHHSPSLVR